ncbi:hypothetical protein ACGYQ5_14340 [Burkholderia pseudomallei]
MYLYEHGATVHGDLFEIGSVYVLTVSDPKFCWDYAPTRANVKVHRYIECGSRAFAFEKEHCSDFSYDGWRIE